MQRNSKRVLAGIFLASFLVRVCFSWFSGFEADERAVYELGMTFFRTHVPSPMGPAVVYTGTQIPGALQSILAGFPLFFSHGHPFGTLVVLSLWTTLGCFWIFRFCSKAFPGVSQPGMAAIIAFAPWTIAMNAFLNPSFAFPFACLYFSLLGQPDHPRKSLWLPLLLILIFQLHLSAYALAAIGVALLLQRRLSLRPISRVLIGACLGALTLIPYFILKMNSGPSRSSALFSNFQWNPGIFVDLLAYFFRFFSFASGDTVRFISGARGYGGMFSYMSDFPVFYLLFIPTLLGSLLIVGLGVYGFIRSLREDSRPLDRVLVTSVTVTAALFFFSIKGPSANAFWLLSPLSFFALIRGYEAWAGVSRKMLITYVVSAVLFTVIGLALFPNIPRIKDF